MEYDWLKDMYTLDVLFQSDICEGKIMKEHMKTPAWKSHMINLNDENSFFSDDISLVPIG